MALVVVKCPSLLTAEAVVAIFETLAPGTFTPSGIRVVVRSATVGRSSALMLSDDSSGKVAWVFKHRVSDGIRLLLGRYSDGSYAFKDVPLPNDLTKEVDLAHNEHYQAAEALCLFFSTPSSQL